MGNNVSDFFVTRNS